MMKVKKGKWISVLLASVLGMSMLVSGCSGQEGTGGSSGNSTGSAENQLESGQGEGGEKLADTSEFVELSMYLIGSESPDHDKVMEKVNEILKEKLNCSLDLKYIGFGEYDTKYPLLLSSGETIDLIYSAGWCAQDEMVTKGAFMDITELVPVYAPQLYAELDMDSLKQIRDGKIFCVPANHRSAAPYGYIVRGDVMEQLGYDSIDSMDQYIEFCTDVNNNTEFQDAMCQSMHELDMVSVRSICGYVPVSGYEYWIKADDKEHKVYFIGDIPELQEFLKKAEERANAGAWSMSVLSNTDSSMMDEGLSAAWLHNLDQYITLAIKHPDWNLQFFRAGEKDYNSLFANDFMAIPTSSKNPERALMCLDLIEHDRELYDLLTYGIEGEHYELDADGKLVDLNSEAYTSENGTWGFRNDDLKYVLAGTPDSAAQMAEDYVNNAPISPLWRFNVDTEPVKNEFAACQNAYNQYYIPISLGYVPYESGMEELHSAMEAAGLDKVLAEMQSQIDNYFASLETE